MDTQNPVPVRSRDVPAAYRVARAIIRFGVWLFFPKLRLVHQEKLDQPRPTILLVTHQKSLAFALLLVAAADRQIHCLLPSGQMHGIFRKLAGRVLGMQTYDSLSEEQDSLLNPCLSILIDQGVIALFTERLPWNDGQRAPVADFAARLSLATTLPGQGVIQPILCPVHWFLRTERRGSEPLICIGGPIQAQPFLPRVGEDVAEACRHLAETVENAMDANVFALTAPEAELFGRELEGLSREHLEEQWSRRPDWKQQVEDLRLSSFVKTWIKEQNRTDPAHLVELRESLKDYRRAHRQCSLGEDVIETSGSWQASAFRLAAAWVETVLGFPVALYGLLNHIPAGVVLSVSGLLKNSPKRDPKVEWLLRIFIVLSFYTAQVYLVHSLWGRATAGYYTLTLPVSGAYLWRYRWLGRHRTRVLVLKALLPARTARLLRRREKILGIFDREIECSPQSPGLPYGRSPNLAE